MEGSSGADAPREWKGWELREAGPPDASRTALLLPGGLGTAAFYAEVLADPRLPGGSVRFAAATPPGFGGRPAPDDLSVEGFARLAGDLAAELGADVLVGHSYSGNIAIEMAASGASAKPLVLLSPSFSREDEFKELGTVDRLGRLPLIGRLVLAIVPRVVSSSMKKAFPEGRREELVSAMRSSDGAVCRTMVRRYFEYLDRHGSLVKQLCDSSVKALVVFGDHEEVGLTDEERAGLEACPHTTLVTIPGATHLLLLEEPAKTVDLILSALEPRA